MCVFLAIGVLLGPSTALASDHPAIAVLLDEKGEPLCKIMDSSNDFPTSELDALEECDARNEFFADLLLGAEEVRIAGVPSPGKISGPALLAAGKIWAKTHGPVLAIISFANICALKKKNPAAPFFFIGTAGAAGFHASQFRFLKIGFGFALLSGMGTILVTRLAANLACDIKPEPENF